MQRPVTTRDEAAIAPQPPPAPHPVAETAAPAPLRPDTYGAAVCPHHAPARTAGPRKSQLLLQRWSQHGQWVRIDEAREFLTLIQREAGLSRMKLPEALASPDSADRAKGEYHTLLRPLNAQLWGELRPRLLQVLAEAKGPGVQLWDSLKHLLDAEVHALTLSLPSVQLEQWDRLHCAPDNPTGAHHSAVAANTHLLNGALNGMGTSLRVTSHLAQLVERDAMKRRSLGGLTLQRFSQPFVDEAYLLTEALAAAHMDILQPAGSTLSLGANASLPDARALAIVQDSGREHLSVDPRALEWTANGFLSAANGHGPGPWLGCTALHVPDAQHGNMVAAINAMMKEFGTQKLWPLALDQTRERLQRQRVAYFPPGWVENPGKPERELATIKDLTDWDRLLANTTCSTKVSPDGSHVSVTVKLNGEWSTERVEQLRSRLTHRLDASTRVEIIASPPRANG